MSELECSICGIDVVERPPAGCEVCHGNAVVQSKGYTLTDHRAGRTPRENRIDPAEGLNPKESPLVTGGHVLHPSHRQNSQ